MKRRILGLVLALSMLMAFTPIMASADTYEGYLEYHEIYDDGSFVVYIDSLSPPPHPNDIVIPEQINGYPVIEISDYAFSSPEITSITIPVSVRKIGSRAFTHCYNLKSITIANNDIEIDNDVFSGIPEICIAYVPEDFDKNKMIDAGYTGKFANSSPDEKSDFEYEIGWEDVTITKYIGTATDVVIPSEIESYPVTSIGYRAFAECENLKSVVIPNSVTRIEMDAFADNNECILYVPDAVDEWSLPYESKYFKYRIMDNGNAEITTCYREAVDVSIPDKIGDYNVTRIGNEAFRDCRELTSISIPEGVESIGGFAFCYCSSLKEITIPDTITSIGGHAFEYCEALEEVSIPDGMTSIEKATFDGCTELKNVNIGNNSSLISINENAFGDCVNLSAITIPATVESIGDAAFIGCENFTSLLIPENVKSIGDSAFAGCIKLTSITIPKNVETIGAYAFDYCRSLTSIYIDKDNANYSSEDGVFFNKNKTELIRYPVGKGTAYIVPESVEKIDAYAFSECTLLENVKLPENITKIEENVFYRCTNLKEIEIPKKVTNIGEMAFFDCNSLTDITILNSATTTDRWAFGGVPSTCVAHIPGGFNKTMMKNSSYNGLFDCPIDVEEGTAYALKDSNTATMRFIWKMMIDDEKEIENIGAYVIPMDLLNSEEVTPTVVYSNPTTTDGQQIKAGNTFAVDIINIPESDYDRPFYAVPFINGNFFMDNSIKITVNEADINK